MPNKQTSKSKRATKPRKKIHQGELDLHGGQGVLQGARSAFFLQVAKLAPEVLDDLRDRPLSYFSELALSERLAMPLYVLKRWRLSGRLERGLHLKTWQWAVSEGTRLANNAPQIPAACLYGTVRSEPEGSIAGLTLDLFCDLWRWQEKYHLKEEWILLLALETLTEWAESGHRDAEQLEWRPYDRIEVLPGPGPNPFSTVLPDGTLLSIYCTSVGPNPLSTLFPDADGYNPVITIRSEYIEKRRRRMRETINGDSDLRLASPSAINEVIDSAIENLEQRCQEVERWYVARGFKSTPDKSELEKHMRWAVEFQVLGRTFSEIAAEEEEEEIYEVSTVSRAAKGALRLIGLSPRPEGLKRGRARGTKISSSAAARLAIIRTLGR